MLTKSAIVKLVTPFVLAALGLAIFTTVQTISILQHQTSNKTTSTNTSRSTAQSSDSPSSNSSSSTGTSTVPNTSVTSAEQTSDITSNWAGYYATGGTFTGVSGTWVVPNASGQDNTSADASWIGIGGVSGSDLIQVGTQNIVSSNGQVTTSAFYELLPAVSQPLDDVSVNPGDSITATIREISSDTWLITLKDNTDGDSYSNTISYESSLSSAEWIEEDPSDGESQIPLDDFGSVTFSGASAIENGSTVNISGSSAQALTMVNSEQEALTDVSTLATDGTGFTVTRTNASSGAGISQFNSDPDGWTRRGTGISGFSGYFNQSPDGEGSYSSGYSQLNQQTSFNGRFF